MVCSYLLKIQKVQPGMPVIILTAHGSILMPLLQHSRAMSVFSWPSIRCVYQAIDDAWNNHASHRRTLAQAVYRNTDAALAGTSWLVAQSDVSVLINGRQHQEDFRQAITAPTRT